MARQRAPRGSGSVRDALHRRAPVLVLVISLGLTFTGWTFADRYVDDLAAGRFEGEGARLETLLTQRMAAYEQVLLSCRALFTASEAVTREEWHAFVQTLDLGRNYPGILGVGYAPRISAGALEEHEAAVRRDGFPDYDVRPAGAREEYAPVVYVAPFQGSNARSLGYDMLSDPTRREAMERARDTAQAALSGRVDLSEQDRVDGDDGFLLYVPVYHEGLPLRSVEERRMALRGYVYGEFRASDIVAGVLSQNRVEVEFQLYDGNRTDPEKLLYGVEPPQEARAFGGTTEKVVPLSIAGHTWTLREQPSVQAVSPLTRAVPWGVLASGGLVSVLLFATTLSLSTRRERAMALAETATRELREKHDELEASNDALEAFTYVVSHDLKEPVRGVEAYLRVVREDYEDELPGDSRDLVEKAHESTLRLSALLKSLLELSRVSREGLVMQPVTLKEVIESDQCRLAYERILHERNGRLEIEGVSRVLAAPSVLAQALGNLIGNALRHGGAEAPVVLVRETGRHGSILEVAVEDNGRGFPPGLAAAFNAGGTETSSAGFGLLIARRALERLGGRMWLGESDRLGGAAVNLQLRAASEDAQAASGEPSAAG